MYIINIILFFEYNSICFSYPELKFYFDIYYLFCTLIYIVLKFCNDIKLNIYYRIHSFLMLLFYDSLYNSFVMGIYEALVNIRQMMHDWFKYLNRGYIKKHRRYRIYYRFSFISYLRFFLFFIFILLFIKAWKRRSMYKKAYFLYLFLVLYFLVLYLSILLYSIIGSHFVAVMVSIFVSYIVLYVSLY